jgi:hypothetical protein
VSISLVFETVTGVQKTIHVCCRVTRSTTAALIYVLHHITRMLENNSYVRCLFIDYSRAFDTINHELLIRKLITFGLHANVVK